MRYKHLYTVVLCSALMTGTSGIVIAADDSNTGAISGETLPAVVVNKSDQAADSTNAKKNTTYIVAGSDPDADLKQQVVNYYTDLFQTSNADSSGSISTSYSATPLDKTRTDIQPITIDVSMTSEDGKVLFSSHELIQAQIQSQNASGVFLVLKNPQVKVDYNSAFSYMNNVTLIPDKTGALPIITETDNVNTAQEGSYTCTVTAVNSIGETETKTFTVVVAKPVEVIAQEKEAARQAELAEQEKERARQAEEAAKAQLERLKAEMPAVAYTAATSGDASPTAENILRIARSWIGGRYVWGGNDPRTGVDCSGFTKWVFAQVGIPLNRTAASQALNGYQVSAADARPGDLVIWSGHVGIYSGNGMMINAENPSRGIREDSLSGFQADGYFMGYYRIPGVN